MLNKFSLLLKDPYYYSYLLRKRIFRWSTDYALIKEIRADSDDGEYVKTVRKIIESKKTFNNFKRLPAYRHILEHVTTEQGAEYLTILNSRNDGMLTAALKNVLRSDNVGNPVKVKYDSFNFALSPTTLRYVKVASDCLHLFGRNLERIAEIGCGYGGQCYVNDQLLSYQSATLFDLPVVNALIKRYLDTHLMQGAYEAVTVNQKMPQHYDLVISNYAFSELPANLQRVYIDKVLSKADRGYLTMNSGIGGPHDEGKLTLAELQKKLPKFECLQEQPQTSEYNYIIVWGHDSLAVEQYFTRKII